MVVVYVISVIMEYTTSYREMLSSEQKLAYSCLCFIDQTSDRYQMQF
jgi:hypothetical protein